VEEKGQAALEVAKEEDATPKARCPKAEVSLRTVTHPWADHSSTYGDMV
jgi:hypothetical protein